MSDPTVPRLGKEPADDRDRRIHRRLESMLEEDEGYILIIGSEGSRESRSLSNVDDATLEGVILDMAEAIRRNRAIGNN